MEEQHLLRDWMLEEQCWWSVIVEDVPADHKGIGTLKVSSKLYYDCNPLLCGLHLLPQYSLSADNSVVASMKQ